MIPVHDLRLSSLTARPTTSSLPTVKASKFKESKFTQTDHLRESEVKNEESKFTQTDHLRELEVKSESTSQVKAEVKSEDEKCEETTVLNGERGSFALFFPDKSMVTSSNGVIKKESPYSQIKEPPYSQVKKEPPYSQIKEPPYSQIKRESPYSQLVELIRSARRTIDLCVFVFSNANLAGELMNLNCDWDRDIDIRIIVDSREDSVNSQVEALINHGFQVKMNPHSGSVLMHHKFMIIDGTILMTGSFNWTRAAVYYNHDNILVTKDPTLVLSYQEEFDNLWKHFIPFSSTEMHF